jgi:multisubunit Na+/H+ antiporter MnhF subunit
MLNLSVLELAIQIAFAMIALAMVLSLYRMVRGPDATDRILALDTLYINTIALWYCSASTPATRLTLNPRC